MKGLTKKALNGDSNGEATKPAKHYHKLERLKSKKKRKDIYRCVDPDCNFYGPSHLLEGKYAICKLCGTQFTLSKQALTLKTPHCGCRNALGFELNVLSNAGKTEEEQTATAMQILEPFLPPKQVSD